MKYLLSLAKKRKELLNEIAMNRANDRSNHSLEQIKIKSIQEFSEKEFTLPLEITGIAFGEGANKDGVFYFNDELEKSATKLSNKKIKTDHNKDNVSAVVGKVTKSWWDKSINAIRFSGWIEDESIASKIYYGLIEYLSVDVLRNTIVMDDGRLAAVDLEYTGLSLVEDPQYRDAKIDTLKKGG